MHTDVCKRVDEVGSRSLELLLSFEAYFMPVKHFKRLVRSDVITETS